MSNDLFNTLSEDDVKFFEEGTLPPETAPADPEPAPAPAPVAGDPEPAPAPAPAPDNSYLERMLEAERQQRIQLDKALADLKSQLQKAQEPTPPDPETQPLEAIQWEFKQLQKKLDDLNNQTQQTALQQQQERQQAAFTQAVADQVQAFMKDHPDYTEAYKHLQAAKTAELKEMGYSAAEIAEKLEKDSQEVIVRAFQNQKNPAEIAYGLAKRYGYKAPEPTKIEPESKVEQIRKGLKAADIPSGGKPKDVEVNASIESLKTASDADLNRMVQEKWGEIFGEKDSKDIF